jgi:hypothetical protein
VRQDGLSSLWPTHVVDNYVTFFRNGGHINPDCYHDYPALVKLHGRQMAQQIIRFRLSNLPEMQAVAEDDDLIDHSDLREVEACDVYMDQAEWEDAKKNVAVFTNDMPAEGAEFQVFEKNEAIKVRFSS